MSIEVIGAEEVAESLKGMNEKTLIFLKSRLNVASVTLQQRILQDLFGGVWGIRSRRGLAGLAGSVHTLEPVETDRGVEAGVAGGAPPMQHGAMFEAGGHGTYVIQGNPVLGWKAFGKFQANTRQKKFAFTADMIFARRVNHPPMKQAKWMTGPANEMVDAITEILKPDDAQAELFE